MNQLKISAAEAMAVAAHGEQKYGDQPYGKHLAHVVEVLLRFGIRDEDMVAAAWLHDSVEDTEMSLLQIEATFGKRTKDLVHRVTNEEGKNRKERHIKTYPKIAESDDAITLKLADRIANTESSIDDKDKLKMYQKEYKSFRNYLYKQGMHDAMWRHLDFLTGEIDDKAPSK